MLQSVGIAIVSSDREKSKKFLELLSKYLPSETTYANVRLQIQTKYYKANPTVLAMNWDDLQSLKDDIKDIYCLLMISKCNGEGNLEDEALLMDQIDSLINKFNPTSYALIVDTPDSELQINVYKLFEKVETFVYVIYESLSELVKKYEMPPIPKSLLYDAVGIVRVVMLLYATTWKEMQFREEAKKEQNEEKKKQSITKVGYPYDSIKIEKQMDEFASIMMEMCSIKNSVLSDEERKQRAEQVIMRLMKGMEDDYYQW